MVGGSWGVEMGSEGISINGGIPCTEVSVLWKSFC